MTTQTITKLQSRGLRSAADLGARRPHGDRLRYMGGCRCDECRAANAAYERERNQARNDGDWNGIVPADGARKHLRWLSNHGIGRRSVAAACDVAETVLVDILSGSKKRIRARTERLIMAVTTDAAADRSRIDAGPTWKLINELLGVGYTRGDIALKLGYARAALQFKKDRITARNAFEVARVHALMINSPDRLTDSKRSRMLIAQLRSELISARQLARQLDQEQLLANGEIILPPRISLRLAQSIEALHRSYME